VAQRLLRENIRTLGVAGETRVIGTDARRLPAAEAPAQLVFLDPPYGAGLGQRALQAAHAAGWIAPEALIVWEENGPQHVPEGMSLLENRKYGDTHVTLLRA
jgi:16S rRNA (guanine966-N2)-methyltransferase